MSTKNPTRLRRELLEQAEHILREHHFVRMERIRCMIDCGEIKPSEVVFPSPPSAEEIIIEARKLYHFIKEN
tara:strand:- start:133 stop:348 length:216 start_codon:yes stop_codon:yes gene_type:complete